MKRILILLVIGMLAVGAAFAEEATLIDFGLLEEDIPAQEDPAYIPAHNRHTLMDFSQYLSATAGSTSTIQQNRMRTSLAIGNWEVNLTSSSARHDNVALSYTKQAQSNSYGVVMGVRVHFPVENWNGSAMVKPPFEIPAFEAPAEIGEDYTITADENYKPSVDESRFEGGYGVVKNVGTIKSLAVDVYGLNFPYGLWVSLLDGNGVEKEVFLGYLNYDGWGQLVWENPQYVQEVRNRELRLYPIYPYNTPFVKFNGFRIERDANVPGGDFITYFKDVKIIYDKAEVDPKARDLDDEGLWSIIATRENAKKQAEMRNFGKAQLLRLLDADKKAPQAVFEPTPTVQ